MEQASFHNSIVLIEGHDAVLERAGAHVLEIRAVRPVVHEGAMIDGESRSSPVGIDPHFAVVGEQRVFNRNVALAMNVKAFLVAVKAGASQDEGMARQIGLGPNAHAYVADNRTLFHQNSRGLFNENGDVIATFDGRLADG
jgi:hypothetical protein